MQRVETTLSSAPLMCIALMIDATNIILGIIGYKAKSSKLAYFFI